MFSVFLDLRCESHKNLTTIDVGTVTKIHKILRATAIMPACVTFPCSSLDYSEGFMAVNTKFCVTS